MLSRFYVKLLRAAALGLLALLLSCSNEEAGVDGAGEESSRDSKPKVSVVVQDRGAVASSEGSYEDNRWTKWIDANAPVDATFVPVLRSESKKLLNVMFASGSAPDIINETNAPFRNNLYEQKQLLPLDELLEHMPNYAALLEQYPQLRQAGTKSDGKLYEIGRVNEAYPLHVLFIRMDWLEKLGLDIPRTTEELLLAAQAFVEQDPDGNGLRDTYGINFSYNSEGVINGMFGIQQEHSWGIADGAIVRQWDKELAALDFKKRLYDLKLVDREYTSDKDGTKAKQDFLRGKLGIYANYSMSWFEFATRDLVLLKQNDPEAHVVPMAYPLSPFGQFTGTIDNPIQMTTVINSRTKNPVAAAQYINFILEQETMEVLLNGERGEHWDYGKDGCPVYPDSRKWLTEVGYSAAYGLFMSRGINKCNFAAHQFNEDDEIQRAGKELYLKAKELYLDRTKQYPGFTHGDHLPGLPNELDMIRIELLKETTDIYVKAIISGDRYSAEQAVTDARAAWDRAGGERIVQYMNEWYRQNKDTAFTAEHLWDIVERQKELNA